MIVIIMTMMIKYSSNCQLHRHEVSERISLRPSSIHYNQGSFFNFLYIFFANTSIILCPKVQLPLFRVSASVFPMRFAKLTLGGELRVRLSLGQVSSLARHFTFTLPLSTLENMNTSRTGSSPRKSERTDAWGRLRTLSYSSGAGRRQEGPKVFADPSPFN